MAKQRKQPNLEKRLIVAVFTPYLYAEKYSYNPTNFHGMKFVKTGNGRLVKLDTKDDFVSKGPDDVLLAIHGSTEAAEEDVRGWRGTGLIVARYSIFYGGPSKYTGRTPEESGYAFDIPKKVEAARALITDDAVIDALIAREADRIRGAIEGLNRKLEQPVLVTPYLEKALAREAPQRRTAPNEDHPVNGDYDPVKCAGCPAEMLCRG